MNIRKYRAATMRDALEKVKSDLGDEALVLGSRQVRDGGFLGIGGRQLVEVSVSTEFAGAKSKTDSKIEAPAAKSSSILGLQRSSKTRPATQTPSTAFTALAARAYSSELSSATKSEGTDITTAVLERAKARTSEVVMPVNKEVIARPVATSEVKTSMAANSEAKSNAQPKRDPLAVELERLYAEVREMKFTLGSFAANARPAAQPELQFNEAGDVDGAIYDSPFYEALLHLENTGLAPEKVKGAARAAVATGTTQTDEAEVAHIGLVEALPSWITFGGDPLQPSLPSPNLPLSQPVVALIGPTGVGKTTTIAKLAARCALRERRRVELITLDTYRIAAVEQLRVYAEIIGAGFHVPRSVLELDALIRKFSGEATILIDTTGRSARDLADQMELADYLRGNEQISKSLLIQATMHPVDAQAAISKFGLFGVDNLMISKLDETSRPGAVVSTIAESRLPLSYICNGQRVPEDIEMATPQSLAASVLRSPTTRTA
jgi:flagellar biosynthesis protein FlhF